MEIKSYELFLESMREISLNKIHFLSQIELYKLGDHIYAVKIQDSHLRAMLFMRPQEFYESQFDEIIGKQFNVNNFFDLYKQHYGKQEFTYGTDWSGFNIPSNILEECMFNIGNDINTYDNLMLSIIYKIKELEGNNKYYLLGVDELENSLLEHEFAHAMYYLLPKYKEDMILLNNNLPKSILDNMYKCISDYGYADHVLPDELQAYMSTGIVSRMECLNIPIKELDKYRKVFISYYNLSLYKNSIKINVNYNI